MRIGFCMDGCIWIEVVVVMKFDDWNGNENGNGKGNGNGKIGK